MADLEQHVQRYLALPIGTKCTLEQLSRKLYHDSRVTDIVSYFSFKHGAPEQRDEIRQEMVIRFVEKMLPEMKEGAGVYSLLYAVAQNVTREIVRQSEAHNSRFELIDHLDDASDNGHQGVIDGNQSGIYHLQLADGNRPLVDDAFEERIISSIDKQSAKALFMDRLPRYQSPHLPTDVEIHQDPPVRKKPKNDVTEAASAAEPFKDHSELASIRQNLRLSMDDFATSLGLKVSTLSSYLYKRTATVPAIVLEAARDLQSGSADEADRLKQIESTPMQEFLAKWLKDARVETIDDLAPILGVNILTTTRWGRGENRPRAKDIVRYERIIEKFSKSLEFVD